MSQPIQEIHRLIDFAAPREIDLLITGEGGSGKELVARTIHAQSPHAGSPFVSVDCRMPAELLERELFHSEGGEAEELSGRGPLFEQAYGGTLFFDEIAALSTGVQARLIELIGRHASPLSRANSVRLIAASKRDPSSAVRDNALRPELLAHFGALHIHVPPLRAHREDVPLLVDHFLRLLRADPGHGVARFSQAAIGELMKRSWAGNVRDLQNYIRTTVLLSPSSVVEVEHLWTPPATEDDADSSPSQSYAETRKRALLEFESDFVRRTLRKAGGNVSLAARMSKIDRKHLWRLIQRTGVRVERGAK